ncbi:hypothetical protein BC332_20177 [Capsicum chinense]|nr:hypothetical protein BC332_20177 [Capsicum chinense]
MELIKAKYILVVSRKEQIEKQTEVFVAKAMAKSKDDVSFGTAQARLSEDDALRIRYGKIADSQPVDLFPSAHRGKIADSQPVELSSSAQNIAAAKQKDEKHQDPVVYEDENLPPADATLMFDSNKADNLTTNPP